MNDERARLAEAASRLEAVSAAIAGAGAGPAAEEVLARLAEEALALSSEIVERVPRAIAEAETAAGAGAEGDAD